jgi:hypothetical protein
VNRLKCAHYSFGLSATSHQPVVFFSVILFSQNKSTPATSQTNGPVDPGFLAQRSTRRGNATSQTRRTASPCRTNAPPVGPAYRQRSISTVRTTTWRSIRAVRGGPASEPEVA